LSVAAAEAALLVQADVERGLRDGVHSTPSFFSTARRTTAITISKPYADKSPLRRPVSAKSAHGS